MTLDFTDAAKVKAAIRVVADPLIALGAGVDEVHTAVRDELGIGLGYGGRGMAIPMGDGATVYAGGGGGGGQPGGAGSMGQGGSAGITRNGTVLEQTECPYCAQTPPGGHGGWCPNG